MELTVKEEVKKLVFIPTSVDCKDAEERYPSVPKPVVVLMKLLVNPKLLMKLTVPNPTTVEASSVGSINEEISVWSPIVVLCKVLAK